MSKRFLVVQILSLAVAFIVVACGSSPNTNSSTAPSGINGYWQLSGIQFSVNGQPGTMQSINSSSPTYSMLAFQNGTVQIANVEDGAVSLNCPQAQSYTYSGSNISISASGNSCPAINYTNVSLNGSTLSVTDTASDGTPIVSTYTSINQSQWNQIVNPATGAH
jgi:hypothetical protein